MVGQQRQHISELQLDQFFNPQSFFVWKISGGGLFFGLNNKILAVSFWNIFQILKMLDVKIASALNKIIQNTRFKKKRSVWRNRKPGKRTGFNEEDRLLT